MIPLYDIIVSFFCLSFIPTNEILYTFFSTLLLSCFRSFHVSSSKDSDFFSKGCMGVCKFISDCILFQALALFGPCWLPGRPVKRGHERLECSLACFPLSSTLTGLVLPVAVGCTLQFSLSFLLPPEAASFCLLRGTNICWAATLLRGLTNSEDSKASFYIPVTSTFSPVPSVSGGVSCFVELPSFLSV